MSGSKVGIEAFSTKNLLVLRTIVKCNYYSVISRKVFECVANACFLKFQLHLKIIP